MTQLTEEATHSSDSAKTKLGLLKGVKQYTNTLILSEGYNWYTLLHDRTNGKPYLGKRVPQVNKYDTQIDKYDIPLPQTVVEETTDKGKQTEYHTDYDSNSMNLQPAKESHSTDKEIKKEISQDTSII